MGLKEEVEEIKKRNRRVEADKAWEVSWTRRILIVVLTYFVIVVFFYVAGLPEPWVNSIVPALAFFVSTLTIGVFKKFWIRNRKV
jgi:membrane protein YdbS with pleckstrin-like domain